jgi:SpoVK/Ycf46/Vps4 family AAA+-type ATPase
MRRLILAVAFALLAAPAAAQEGANVCPSAETAHALGAESMRYVGEAEKSLHLVFADARVTARSAALLFDEAESLLGGRTDVRDASDRYAKQDIAYLLGYRGRARPVVLDAFPRRAFAAGFRTASRNAGLIVIETETGVATLEIRGMVSERAVAFAREFTKVCGVR